MEKYDGRRSGFETEIRGFVEKPKAFLEKTVKKGEYSLEDIFYVPKQGDEWNPRDVTLRLRDFSPVGYQVIFSTQLYIGPVKMAKKYILADGEREDMKELLDALGFKPLFNIQRKAGYFLHLKDEPEQTMVLEDIENIGWMFEAHVEAGQEFELLEKLGLFKTCLLNESLPSYYYQSFIL